MLWSQPCFNHRILCIDFFFFFAQSIDQLIEDTVPASIRMQKSMKMDDPLCKLNISLSICVHIWFNNPVMWPEEAARPVSMRSIQSDKSHQKKSTRKHCVSPPHIHTHSSPAILARRKGFFFLLFLPTWMKPSEWLKCRLHLYCASWKRAPLVSLPLNIFGVVFAKLGERHQSPVGKPMLIGWQLECKVEPWAPVPSPVQSGYSVHITSQPRGFLIRWLRFDLHGIFLYLIIFIFPPSFLSCNVLTFHLLDAQDFFNFIYFF